MAHFWNTGPDLSIRVIAKYQILLSAFEGEEVECQHCLITVYLQMGIVEYI